jgi:hypothetical protein
MATAGIGLAAPEAAGAREDEVEVSFVIPCLNEAESLGHVIDEINAAYAGSELRYEIVVADNGSTDGSQAIATARGARIETVSRRGYGAALIGGIAASRGRYIVMGDADGSYPFADAEPMVDRLRHGADMVMGNRFAGGIEQDAMPWLHRYIGNPLLSAIGQLLFGLEVRDFHCGLRAFKRDRILGLGLNTPGMEFASEMLVMSRKAGYRIEEVPVRLLRDLRSRPPHLRTWRDGWRHLRFMLLRAPTGLFVLPAVLIGGLSVAMALAGPLALGSVQISYRTSIIASALATIATVAGWTSYVAREAIGEPRRGTPVGRMAVVATAVTAVGLAVLIAQLVSWQRASFGQQTVGRATLATVAGADLFAIGLISLLFALLVGLVRNLR